MGEKIHVVAGTTGGYAREDADQATVYGAFSDPSVAEKVRKSASCSAQIFPIDIDDIAPGYLERGRIIGYFRKDEDPIGMPPVSGRLSKPNIEVNMFSQKSGDLHGLALMTVFVGKKQVYLARFYIKENGELDGNYDIPKKLSAQEIFEIGRLALHFSKKLDEIAAPFRNENGQTTKNNATIR